MPKISKRVLKEIEFASVYDAVLKEYNGRRPHIGFFTDNPPEMWSDDEKLLFDIASEVEERFRALVLKILAGKQAAIALIGVDVSKDRDETALQAHCGNCNTTINNHSGPSCPRCGADLGFAGVA